MKENYLKAMKVAIFIPGALLYEKQFSTVIFIYKYKNNFILSMIIEPLEKQIPYHSYRGKRNSSE